VNVLGRLWRGGLGLIIAGAALVAQASGVDCGKTSSSIDKLICGDSSLKSLDGQLRTAYGKVERVLPDSRLLAQEQEQWLGNRRERCADAACLNRVYHERINELATWDDAPIRMVDATGDYGAAENCLHIENSAPGRLSFYFLLVGGGNGQTCEMRGTAVRVSDSSSIYRYRPAPQLMPAAGCRLGIRITRHAIWLQDPDGGCRAMACGTRIGIDATGFLRANRSATRCKP
jgi:uncharacterized protein